MSYQVITLPSAEARLGEIQEWLISNDQESTWAKVREAIPSVTLEIAKMPTRYPRLRADSDVTEFRVAPMLWYKIIYRIDEAAQVVTINYVAHERQDMGAVLRKLTP